MPTVGAAGDEIWELLAQKVGMCTWQPCPELSPRPEGHWTLSHSWEHTRGNSQAHKRTGPRMFTAGLWCWEGAEGSHVISQTRLRREMENAHGGGLGSCQGDK